MATIDDNNQEIINNKMKKFNILLGRANFEAKDINEIENAILTSTVNDATITNYCLIYSNFMVLGLDFNFKRRNLRLIF